MTEKAAGAGYTNGLDVSILRLPIWCVAHSLVRGDSRHASTCQRTDGLFSRVNSGSFATRTKNANQSRRLLSLAAVLDGMSRTEAAQIGGMDRQTLRDWVHRFNEHGLGRAEGYLVQGQSVAPVSRSASRVGSLG